MSSIPFHFPTSLFSETPRDVWSTFPGRFIFILIIDLTERIR